MRYNHQQAYLRRRRRQEGGARWSVILRTFAVLVVGVSLALFYVWQNVQLVRVGYQIKAKERALLELSKRSKALEIDVTMLKMPSRVVAKIEEEELGLDIPKMWQIVKLQEEPVLYEEDLISPDWGYEDFRSGALIDISDK